MTNRLKIEETPTRLAVTLGWPWFNGSVSIFDRSSGRARFTRRNVFVPFRPVDVALGEIADVQLVRFKGARDGPEITTSTHPRVTLTSGKAIDLLSLGVKPGEIAVPRIRAFLFGPDAPPDARD